MSFVYQALKGMQFEDAYYQVNIPYGELEQVTYVMADVQRKLNKRRVADISDYITSNEDAWLPAITLASPTPLEFRRGDVIVERLSVIDGQHRRGGILAALSGPQGHILSRSQIPAVIFPNLPIHRQSQLFADLNGKAKPVTKAVRYHRDFRDHAILATRDVIANLGLGDQVEYFTGHVNMQKGKEFAFTWLVEANRTLLAVHRTDDLNSVRLLTEFWGTVYRALHGKWGDREYICSSAVALKIIALAGRAIFTEEGASEAILKGLQRVNWQRFNGDFTGILVNTQGRVVIGGGQGHAHPEAVELILDKVRPFLKETAS